jgi:hypothetical protein
MVRQGRSYELNSLRPLMDCRVTALTRIGERSDAVLRTAIPGNDTAAVARGASRLGKA